MPTGTDEFRLVIPLQTIVNAYTVNIFIGFLGTNSFYNSTRQYYTLKAVYRLTGGNLISTN
jgi:hypothetical protein